MDSLAVYWNCGLESYADRPKSAMQQCLKDNVATGTHKPNYHYCNCLHYLLCTCEWSCHLSITIELCICVC